MKKNKNTRGESAKNIIILDEVVFPLAQTFIDGKPAPWSPYGVESDPRKFSRRKEDLCKECGLNNTFCKCEKKEGE